MIKHIVCFKMKEGCSAEEAKQMLLSMREHEQTALSVEVGIDGLRSPRSYDLILQVTLAGWEELNAYQTAGYHAKVVKPYMHGVVQTEKSVAIDYEI